MRMAAIEPAKAHRRTSSAPPMRTAAMMSSSVVMEGTIREGGERCPLGAHL